MQLAEHLAEARAQTVSRVRIRRGRRRDRCRRRRCCRCSTSSGSRRRRTSRAFGLRDANAACLTKQMRVVGRSTKRTSVRASALRASRSRSAAFAALCRLITTLRYVLLVDHYFDIRTIRVSFT